MIRAALIYGLFASTAAAQNVADIDRLWTTFMRVCPQMLTDPNAYLQALPIPGPHGEPVVTQSADGKITEFDTTMEGDVHHAIIVVVGPHQEIGCGMTSNPLAALNGPTSADAANAHFQQKIATRKDLEISGGKVNKQVSMGAGMTQADSYYQYYMTGLVPNVDAVAMAIFGQGFHSLHMHRYMRSGENN